MAAIEELPHRRDIKSPHLISDKLLQFLSEAYLGPLYDNGTVGERIGAYLYFLTPDDPLYRVTSKPILMQLLLIYRKANDIQFQEVEDISGKNPDTQIRNYFGDEYNKVFQKYADHQREYGEIVGQPKQFNFNGSPAGNINLLVPQIPCYRVWWVPMMLSSPIMMRIEYDNTELYELEDDEEYDYFVKKTENLLDALQTSSRSMRNHPEVTDAATPFKTITRTPTKAFGKV